MFIGKKSSFLVTGFETFQKSDESVLCPILRWWDWRIFRTGKIVKYFRLSRRVRGETHFDIFEWLEIKGRPFLLSLRLFIMNSSTHRLAERVSVKFVDLDPWKIISGLFDVVRIQVFRFMMSAWCVHGASVTVCTCWWFSNRKRQSAALSSTLINKALCSVDQSDLWFPFDIFLSICVRCFGWVCFMFHNWEKFAKLSVMKIGAKVNLFMSE